MTNASFCVFFVAFNVLFLMFALAEHEPHAPVAFQTKYTNVLTYFDPTARYYRYYSLGERRGLTFFQAQAKCVDDEGFLAKVDPLSDKLQFLGNWMESFEDFDVKEADPSLSVRRPVWIDSMQGSPSPVCKLNQR